MGREKESGLVKKHCWCHLIGLESLFLKTPIITPKKTNRSARSCIWRYRFQAGVWNCQILNQVVDSPLFTSFEIGTTNSFWHWAHSTNQSPSLRYCSSTVLDRTAVPRTGLLNTPRSKLHRASWMNVKNSIHNLLRIVVYMKLSNESPRKNCSQRGGHRSSQEQPHTYCKIHPVLIRFNLWDVTAEAGEQWSSTNVKKNPGK
jgi:hypothetical protein